MMNFLYTLFLYIATFYTTVHENMLKHFITTIIKQCTHMWIHRTTPKLVHTSSVMLEDEKYEKITEKMTSFQ